MNNAPRLLYRPIFATVALWVFGVSFANAAPVEFACGTAVQCLGEKSADGTPNCPKVNACINNRGNRALFWKMHAATEYF